VNRYKYLVPGDLIHTGDEFFDRRLGQWVVTITKTGERFRYTQTSAYVYRRKLKERGNGTVQKMDGNQQDLFGIRYGVWRTDPQLSPNGGGPEPGM